MSSECLKILVVDDSALYRQSIQNVLRENSQVRVVGSAKNGVDALQKIDELSPDVVTLDVQMPDMDGIQVLRALKRKRQPPTVIMVSSLTAAGAQVTTEALMEGAFDFILKPAGGDPVANRRRLHDELAEKIEAIQGLGRRSTHRRTAVEQVATEDSSATAESSLAKALPSKPCRLAMIGTSTGGPEALKTVLPKLVEQLPVPLLIVQHMPAQYTRSLAERLDSICPLPVQEAHDGQELEAGNVLVAPGGQHMKIHRSNGRVVVKITNDAPEQGVRPSFDYLLRSAVEMFGSEALAIVLTGMGRDGLEGCRLLKQAGGFVFAQDQVDCVVYGMPKAVIEAGLADRVLSLGKIAPAIFRHIKRSQRQISGGQA